MHSAELMARFRKFFTPGNPGECWLWTGRKCGGYGEFMFKSRLYKAHRIACSLSKELLPTQLACHHCDTPACVNPDHLYAGSLKDNANDRERRNRQVHPRGSDHVHAKLTDERVMDIRSRAANGETQKDLAAAFGVARSLVSSIVNGKAWKHVPMPVAQS